MNFENLIDWHGTAECIELLVMVLCYDLPRCKYTWFAFKLTWVVWSPDDNNDAIKYLWIFHFQFANDFAWAIIVLVQFNMCELSIATFGWRQNYLECRLDCYILLSNVDIAFLVQWYTHKDDLKCISFCTTFEAIKTKIKRIMLLNVRQTQIWTIRSCICME